MGKNGHLSSFLMINCLLLFSTISHGLEIVAAQIINILGTLEVQVEATQSYHNHKQGVGIMNLFLEEMGIMTMCLSLSTMGIYECNTLPFS